MQGVCLARMDHRLHGVDPQGHPEEADSPFGLPLLDRDHTQQPQDFGIPGVSPQDLLVRLTGAVELPLLVQGHALPQ